MSPNYQPGSKRVRPVFAAFAAMVTLILAIGIDGLAGHYHAAGDAAASETTQPA